MHHDPAPLAGLVLVLTRPQGQAGVTQERLTAAGASVFLFPVLAIEAIETPEAAAAGLPTPADAAIFVSANAVEFGWQRLQSSGALGPQTALLAIGETSARALRTRGAQHVLTPAQGQDSEGLLALPALASVREQRIVLVRGASEGGGRRTLEQTLAARGARVASLLCYRRRKISAGEAARGALRDRLRRGGVHAFFALSVETAESLCDNLQGLDGWQRSSLLVPHARVAAAARTMGFGRVHVAPMEDATLLEWLRAYKKPLMEFTEEPLHG